MRYGILTGGGDCPGLNAVIRAATTTLCRKSGNRVFGICGSFEGLSKQGPMLQELTIDSVSDILRLGGTILGTKNNSNPQDDAQLMLNIKQGYDELGLSAVIAIGGDGTMSIANELSEMGMNIVGVPKTIDNDIVGCETSFGFDTAVATVTESINRIETTARSHQRVMIIETMGRHAGWIPMHAGIASGAHCILVPEMDFDVEAIADLCNGREYTLICLGEGAKPINGELILLQEKNENSVQRLGGIGQWLANQLESRIDSEVRVTVLGHLQRGGDPTAFDRFLATRYGARAAELAMNQVYGKMVTLKNGVLDTISIKEVANRQKVIGQDSELFQVCRDLGISFGT